MTQNTGLKHVPFWKRKKVKLLINHVCVTSKLTTVEQSRLDSLNVSVEWKCTPTIAPI